MRCEYCNKEIPVNSAFCPECGKKQEISVSKKYICPICGAPLECNDLFCSECGTPCDPIPIDTPPRRAMPHLRHGASNNVLADTVFFKTVIIAVFFILILALAMSLFFLYKRVQTDKTSHKLISTAPQDAADPKSDETENSGETDPSAPLDKDDANDTAEPTENNISNDYILPQSTSRLLNSSDISGLNLREINYAKNEIYARHGRMFNSSELQNYFNSKSWYNGTIRPDAFGESFKTLGLLFLCLLYIYGCKKDSAADIVNNYKQESQEDSSTPKLFKIIQDIDTESADKSSNANEKDERPEADLPTPQFPKKGILIALDPGHQDPNIDMSAQEPIAPDSDILKAKASGGTKGTFSGIPEYQLNLDIAQMVYSRLTAYGYDVILTRENNDTAISNAERAILANDAGADISVRIHANGSEDPNANGALVLIGSAQNPYTASLYKSSYRLGETVLSAYCNATGMQNLGIQFNDSMTGINWSQIPVIILEMGFMTNPQDDLNMADAVYREKMADGIVSGIHAYYGFYLEDLSRQIQTTLAPFQASGSEVSVYVEKLSTGAYASLNSQPMQAASLIKLYIAGCIHEHLEALQEQESYPGETEKLLRVMITISDNDAANTLVKRLGSGDAQTGMALINHFCQTHNFTDTHIGRLMLAPNDTDDNYTSVADCGKFLQAIYQKRLIGSDSILDLMKQQVRTEKIPAGIPTDVTTANKTGELSDVENDVAIIFDKEEPYIVCIMMCKLTDTYSARTTITSLSSQIYQYICP